MKSKQWIAGLLGCLCLVLFTTACSDTTEQHQDSPENHEGHDHEHDHDHEGHEHSSEESGAGHEHSVFEEQVTLSKTSRELIGVTTDTATLVSVNSTIPVFGETELLPQAQFDVSSVFDANIKSIHIVEGQYVREGQTLFELSHPDISAVKDEIVAQRATVAFLQAEVERAKQLQADNFTSLEDVQNKVMQLTVAHAQLQSLLAKCEAAGFQPNDDWDGSTLRVVAPTNGNIRKVSAMIGDFVESGTTLVTIVNAATELHADFQVFQKEALNVKIGQTIVFQADGYDEVFTGEIFAISAELEEGSHSRHIHAHVHENPRIALIPGMKLHGNIIVSPRTSLGLSDSSVVEMEGKQAVFREVKPGLYRPVHIQTGLSSGGYTEVMLPDESLLSARFVVVGAWEMMSELTNTGVGCAH